MGNTYPHPDSALRYAASPLLRVRELDEGKVLQPLHGLRGKLNKPENEKNPSSRVD